MKIIYSKNLFNFRKFWITILHPPPPYAHKLLYRTPSIIQIVTGTITRPWPGWPSTYYMYSTVHIMHITWIYKMSYTYTPYELYMENIIFQMCENNLIKTSSLFKVWLVRNSNCQSLWYFIQFQIFHIFIYPAIHFRRGGTHSLQIVALLFCAWVNIQKQFSRTLGIKKMCIFCLTVLFSSGNNITNKYGIPAVKYQSISANWSLWRYGLALFE